MRIGQRLPPIREVAGACDVTRATVQEAYRQLAERGLVEGTVGRGTTVLGRAPGAAGERGAGVGAPEPAAPLRHLRGAGLLALDLLPELRGFVAKRMIYGARAWP